VRVIREDGKIEAADLTFASAQGTMTVRFDGQTPIENTRPAVFVGFRVSRAGNGPGPKARRRLRWRLRRADADDPEHLARSRSYLRQRGGAVEDRK
jgi:hypothetical protein